MLVKALLHVPVQAYVLEQVLLPVAVVPLEAPEMRPESLPFLEQEAALPSFFQSLGEA